VRARFFLSFVALATTLGAVPLAASDRVIEEGMAAVAAKNYIRAAELWWPLAEQGHVEAQYRLGWLLETYSGSPKDDVWAERWYRKAAEQGHADAQLSLAMMYEYGSVGDGVAEDSAEAVKWYRKAGEQGIVMAQMRLAIKYQDGEGVAKDQFEATRLCIWSKNSNLLNCRGTVQTCGFSSGLACAYNPGPVARAFWGGE